MLTRDIITCAPEVGRSRAHSSHSRRYHISTSSCSQHDWSQHLAEHHHANDDMHLSQRQWRASLSGVVLTVAWICYYFLTPKSPEERLAHAYSEFEKLQARIDELHGAALSYNFAIAFEKNTTTVNVEDEFAKLKTLLASAEKSSNDVQNEAHSKRVPEILLTTYQKLVKKGRYLWSILDNPDCGPKSRWTNYAELDSWGWVRTEYPPVAGADKLGRFVDALNGRGLSTREEDYLDISWDHKKTTRHYRTDLEVSVSLNNQVFFPPVTSYSSKFDRL